MNINKAYKFKQINDLISSSGTVMNVNLQSFSEQGYELVINLLPDDSKHATGNEKHLIESQGIQYCHIAVDWDNPKSSDFESFEAIMKASQDKKIHIHCAANYRATAFYGMFACKYFNWTKEQFNELTSEIWQLSEYPTWVKFVSDNTQIPI